MTLFWCEIHDASAPHKTAHCWYAVAKANDRSGWGAGVCRVVERRLVALDGIDLERIARICLESELLAYSWDDAPEPVRQKYRSVAFSILAALDQEAT